MRLPFVKSDSDEEYEEKGELPLVTAASHPEFLEPMSFQLPTMIGHQPTAISLQLPTIGHQPSAISLQLPAIGHQPSAISLQLPTMGHQPSAISLQHPTARSSDPGPRSLVQQSKEHRGRRSGVLLRRSESIYGQVNNDHITSTLLYSEGIDNEALSKLNSSKIYFYERST
jgi:hypothetical protein